MSTSTAVSSLVRSNANHERISALFLGPKAENADFLRECLTCIVDMQVEGRKKYFPDDPPFITQDIQKAPAFVEQRDKTLAALCRLLDDLSDLSIPFYSPRYSAHMSVDQNLPAILGYLSTMFYNPNNVAYEASPFTTEIELKVGSQLCTMLGYTVNEKSNTAWGHVTCDGTVANLESIWASRNLKFYPLSLRQAMKEELKFIADTFKLHTCDGTYMHLDKMGVWDLLNLPVPTILGIPEQLQAQYGISTTFLENTMKKYIIQTTGKDKLIKDWNNEHESGIEHEPAMFVPSTKHYSWPKGAAIAGLGSDNCISIPVDIEARMDIEELTKALNECVERKQSVYEVVAVIGTTEEGAIDRLNEIINLRDEFQQKGLSFVVHADAAWGGYFASMLSPESDTSPSIAAADSVYVPNVALRCDTETQLRALRLADSVTIDPHKAGYVPYPAGSLCYKDGRMRYLLTWDAPYLNKGSGGQSIGIYGVEGSKPGAAATSIYLSHQVIGLNETGMGSLLGEASFTCRRFASHWAAMSSKEYVVVPFNLWPSERTDTLPKLLTEEEMESERENIRNRILTKDNEELVDDNEAMNLLNSLGSDLNINAFACNFRNPDGTLNKDIGEANWLNRRIFETLSTTRPEDSPLDIPFYLTSTVFSQEEYGKCAEHFKKRLGLEGEQDLFVLRNVVMSPFTTTRDFMSMLVDEFKKVLEKEVKNVIERNISKSTKYTFLVYKSDKTYLVLLPQFHVASGRSQLVLSVNLQSPQTSHLKLYEKLSATGFVLVYLTSTGPISLEDIKPGFSFDANLSFKARDSRSGLPVKVDIASITRKRTLVGSALDSTYPELMMPFYLFGSTTQLHIDHILCHAPNIQLSAGRVKGTFNPTITNADLEKGLIAVANNVSERAMQPFPSDLSNESDTVKSNSFFFSANKTLKVAVYSVPETNTFINVNNLPEADKVSEGILTIEGGVYVDSVRLNREMEDGDDHALHFTSSGRMTDSTVAAWEKRTEELDASLQM